MPALPTRWWVQLDSKRSSNGRLTPEEFWRLVDPADQGAESFRSQSIPTVPGLYFGGESPTVDWAVIESWCHSISQGRFPFPLPAIIVQFGSSDQARREVTNLSSRLRRILSDDIPIEAVKITGVADDIADLQIENLPSKPSPATEALALAFLRRWEVDRKNTERAIKQMRSYLSPETRDVWKFLQQGATAAGQKRLLKQYGWRGLQRAIEAGAVLSTDFLSMQRYGLEEPEFWWLLGAMTPNEQLLSNLLRLDAKLRAVVGLCTEQEWHDLRGDTALWNAISHCRRDELLAAPASSYR